MDKLWSVERRDEDGNILGYRIYVSYQRALEIADEMRESCPHRTFVVRSVNVDSSIVKPYAQGA